MSERAVIYHNPQAVIVDARDKFLQRKEDLGVPEVLAYDLDYDFSEYTAFQAASYTGEEEFVETVRALQHYTHKQLETHIGERLNTAISRWNYEIKDGQLFGENAFEPAIEMYKRGRDYRKQHGNPSNWEREDAEVRGMERIEAFLASDEAIGKKVISISKPGGDYTHDFVDIHEAKQKDGKRYIESVRISTQLSMEESFERFQALSPKVVRPEKITDAYFLDHPVVVGEERGLRSIEDVQAFFHKDGDFMSEGDFEVVRQVVAPYIRVYTRHMLQNPHDRENQKLLFNAILNKADEVAENVKRGVGDKEGLFVAEDEELMPSMVDINRLGRQSVRSVSTGCGASGGFKLKTPLEAMQLGPFSVADFGNEEKDEKGSLYFDCPSCGYKNKRPKGGFVKRCQNDNCSDPEKVWC